MIRDIVVILGMNIDFQQHIPTDLNPKSRVWIYQSSRMFSVHEALQIEDLLKDFIERWNAHGSAVKGYGNLFFGQFIILIADESYTGVSGCSIDSSVRFIKDIEQLFQVQMFDRQLLAFIVKERVQLIPLSQLDYALQHHFINADTLYFNNTVQYLDQLLTDWLIPVKKSWLNAKFSFPASQATEL